MAVTIGNWRWYTDIATDASLVALAAENTVPVLTPGQTMGGIARLRVQLVGDASGGSVTIQGAHSVDGTTFRAWETNLGERGWVMRSNGAPTAGATLSQLKLTGSTAAGKYHGLTAQIEAVAANEIREIDISFQPRWWGPDITVIQRLLNGATALTYQAGVPTIAATACSASQRKFTIAQAGMNGTGQPREVDYSCWPRMLNDGNYWWWVSNVPSTSTTNLSIWRWDGTGYEYGNWVNQDYNTTVTIGGSAEGAARHAPNFRKIGSQNVFAVALKPSSGNMRYLRGLPAAGTITWQNIDLGQATYGATTQGNHCCIDDGGYHWVGGFNATTGVWACRSTAADDGTSGYTPSFGTIGTRRKTATDASTTDASGAPFAMLGLSSDKALCVWMNGLTPKWATVTDAGGFSTPASVGFTLPLKNTHDWCVAVNPARTKVYMVGRDSEQLGGETGDQGGTWEFWIYDVAGNSWTKGTTPQHQRQNNNNDGIIVCATANYVYVTSTGIGPGGNQDRPVQLNIYNVAAGTWAPYSHISPVSRGNGDDIAGSTMVGDDGRVLAGYLWGDNDTAGHPFTFEFYMADTGEAGNLPPALNANVSHPVGSLFRLRFELQETNAVSYADGYELRYSKNGGAYTKITTATDVRPTASQFTDGAATTDLLPSATGTFVAGEGDDINATTGTITIPASGNTELEFSLILNTATAGDTFDFRLYKDDGTALNTYTQTPRLTAIAGTQTDPISGAETVVLSEGAAILQLSSSRTESMVTGESPLAISAALTTLDSHAFSELASTLQTLALLASDSSTFADVASRQETSLVSVIDSWGLNEVTSRDVLLSVLDALIQSDVSAPTATMTVSDSVVVTDTSNVAPTTYMTAVDAWALAEAVAQAEQRSISLTDALVLSESLVYSELLTLSLVDSTALLEAASSIAQATTASDTLSQQEGTSTLTGTSSASDLLSVGESVAMAGQLAASDSVSTIESATSSQLLTLALTDALIVSEASSLLGQAMFSASDAGTMSDNIATLSSALSVFDANALGEAVTAAITASVVDSIVQSETFTDAGELRDLALTDALTLVSEVVALSLSFSRTDTLTLSEALPSIALTAADDSSLAEALAVAASLAAADALALTLEASTGGEARDLTVSDASILAESAALLSSVFKVASDAFTGTEARLLTSILSSNDTSALSEFLSIIANLAEEDSLEVSEVAALAARLTDSDSSVVIDLAALNTAAFVRVLASVVSAAATMKAMTTARATDSNTLAVAVASGDVEAEL